jgi:dTDP-4-amino-4,6-dideoxygalactose transaminase
MGAGIGAGDEVILPANTFFATAEAVVAAGARPVLADVDPATASIDPSSVTGLVGPRTAAVVAVHLYGHPADVASLGAVAADRGLLLLEDAAQAMGATFGGRQVGSLGDAAAFSFFPTKLLGGLGEGGAVTTDDPALAARVRLLRSHGERVKNVHEVMGFNERLDELHAALLMVKLSRLAGDLHRREAVVNRYLRLLATVDHVGVPGPPPGGASVHHLMVVTVPERDRVLADLHARGVGAGVHYPTPIHLQPAWQPFGPSPGPGDLPHAEALARSVLSLPLYPEMTFEQVDRCVDALAEAVGA